MPEAPQLSGWQYVILEVAKMLIPIAISLIAIWQADKANDRANSAGREATEARSEVGKFRVMYGAKGE